MDKLTDVETQIVTISALIGVDKTADNFAERSELFHKSGLYQQAYEDAKCSLKINSKSLRGLIAAGKATMKLQKFDECYNYYKEGLVIDPNNSVITEDLRVLQNAIMEEYEKKTEMAPETVYNAVTLCSQDIYPGDDELFKLELEILGKKYKVQTAVTMQTVDLNKRKEAATIGVMAYNCRQGGQYTEALHHCNKALEKDLANFRLLQMRAETYLDLDTPHLALQDLMFIPKPARTLEIWKMGGKLLKKFDLPVMAEFWLRKATAMGADNTKDIEAATLFQKVRVKRTYGPLTMDYPVRVDFTECGRGVMATAKLHEDENAFEDVPVVIGQLLNCIHLPACGHCGMSLITQKDYFGKAWDTLPNDLQSFADEYWPDVAGVVCRRCEREKYCSAACRDVAWERYHQTICPSTNSAATQLYDLIDSNCFLVNEKGIKEDVWGGQYSPIILAKIWGSIVTEAKRLMKEAGLLQPTPQHWARGRMSFRKFISFGNTSAVKRMPEMFKLMQTIFADCGDGVTYDITEKEFEARYYQATCNLQAFSGAVTPKHKFMENISKVEDIRALKMIKYLDEKPPTVAFAGMFPLHACLNHACNNNVQVMDGVLDGKPAVDVRVRRDIEPGEELFTTYIDTTMPRKLRRAWLYKSFNFWCACKRCQFEGDDNTSCTNCKKSSSEGKKFPGCSRCKRAWYCSTKCQKQSWVKGHKSICEMDHTAVHMQIS